MRTTVLSKQIRNRLGYLCEMLFKPTSAEKEITDLVIVLHEKDVKTLEFVFDSWVNNINEVIDKIIIISNVEIKLNFEVDLYVLEDEFEEIRYVKRELCDSKIKGWIIQQIIKLSAISLSDKYIVIDADTLLLRKHDFWVNGKPVIRRSNEHGCEYVNFESSIGLLGNDTYICHMGAFDKKINYGYFEHIRRHTGQEWYKYIVNFLNSKEGLYSEWNSVSKYIIKNIDFEILFWANKSIDYINNKEAVKVNWWRDSLSLHRHEV